MGTISGLRGLCGTLLVTVPCWLLISNCQEACAAQQANASSEEESAADTLEGDFIRLSLKLREKELPEVLKVHFPQHFPGERIVVEATVENISNQPFMLITGHNLHSLVYFNVVKKVGDVVQEVPRTLYGKSLPVPKLSITDFSGKGPVVKPDKPLRIDFNLSRQFDLSEPGDYEVSAYMIPEIFGGEKNGLVGKVTAEPVTLTIRPRKSGDDESTY